MLALHLPVAANRYSAHNERTGEGRLIRVSKYRGDPEALAYLVAVPDKAEALQILKAKAGQPGDDIEDLGRVSEALIKALSLAPGELISIGGVRHVAQHQQQSQIKANP